MLGNLKDIFFPRICVTCEFGLLENEELVCTQCLHSLPIIQQQKNAEELIKKHLYGRIDISKASALMFYDKKGLAQKMIHKLKYRGEERISGFLGNWLGNILAEEKWIREVDVIIPVPLHKSRKRKRGYNQVTGFGMKMAEIFECEYTEEVLIKVVNSRTQVFKDRFARTEVQDAYFTLKNPERIAHKHILLIDDIITTGATLETCAEVLLEAQPKKISIATMAITV